MGQRKAWLGKFGFEPMKTNENREKEKDKNEVAQPEVEGLDESFDPNDQKYLENPSIIALNPDDEASFCGPFNVWPLPLLMIFTNLVSMCMFEFFIFNL